MPIYEYVALNPASCCQLCGEGFEVVKKINDDPLKVCPDCGRRVRKKVSSCFAAVVEGSLDQTAIEKQIRDHEKGKQWSKAAELADSHAEKTNDRNMKSRALDNYKKAGYHTDALSE